MNDSSLPKIRAVTFDMDGLMFNTEDLYDVVGDQLLVRRGQRFTRELKLKMMGLPGDKAFAVMIRECGLDDSVAALQDESRRLFAELLPKEIRMMPGLEELLTRIEAAGLPKAVATSSHIAFAQVALSSFELMPRFSFVLTAESVQQGKPHPEVYQLAARRHGVAVDQMLVLEDSVIGSTAAAAAGAFVIAVPTEHSQGQDFSHVDRTVNSLTDPFIEKLISHAGQRHGKCPP